MRELKEACQIFSCESNDEIESWYANDRQTLDQRQVCEFLGLRSDQDKD